MKSKTEIRLDKEFEKIGVKPHIYHFTEDVFPFEAITIATQEWSDSWEAVANFMRECRAFIVGWEYNHATKFLYEMATAGFYGVAICDKRDQFNRKRGRIIAKGRLLKHLKEKNRNAI